MMKMLRIYGLFVFTLGLLPLTNISAQYNAALSNSQLVNDRTFEFDFIIKSTGADFTLASYQGVFSYNVAIANGGALTFSYIVSSSELVNVPLSASIENADGTPELCFSSFMGNDVISSTYRKVGRFRLTNTVAFANVTPDIAWNFAGSINTILANQTVDITNPVNFSNLDSAVPLPVELTSFSAASTNNNIILNWKTATETNTSGFEVERKSEDKKDLSWQVIGFVNGSSNSNVTKYYNFEDKNISLAGKYFYRLKTIDLDGSFKYSDEIMAILSAPEKTILEQNYPNPFNPQTNIKFKLSSDSYVKLYVYAINGEMVETIVNEYKAAGFYSVNWNANNLASGMYISMLETITANGNVERSIKKMLFVK